MRKGGNHTWDIIIEYHQCPFCGTIVESRNPFEERMGTFYKNLICHNCQKHFEIQKKATPKFGPFFGNGKTTPEIEW